jgi:tetratricopeptide (TPR) repeat protein
MTGTLLALIDRGATYTDVKNELFALNDFAPLFIEVTEYSQNGEKLYVEKDYLGSAAQFTKAIAIDPEGPEYYFSRGRAYLQLGKNAEAIADYTKVIQLKGTTPSAVKNLPVVYHNRGLCYGLIAKNPQAIADLTMAIKLRPDYASAYKLRSLVYRKMGNVRLANADLQTAEKLQPGITK